jgi:hypothetical protein
MKNREVFLKDPTGYTIPNDGVTTIINPSTDKEWEVLEYELRTFVCEGEYERGLDRILTTFMTHLDQPKQPAVWVSGFYGSGKSHLVRVLEYLWRDVELPSGAQASSLVDLPVAVQDLFRELKTHGTRHGGLWSAAGTLRESAGDNVRLALLAIAFRSAGLPDDFRLARFVIWLKQNGYYEAVRQEIESQSKDFMRELRSLYVSPYIASAVLKVYPGLAQSEADARLLFREEYPKVEDISNDEFLTILEYVLELQSDKPGKLPLTLLIFDELQQFIGDDVDRATRVQEVVQVCTSRFGSQLLFLGTGQTQLEADTNLSRLKDRFTAKVELEDSDVERVVRKVVLRKAPDKIAMLENHLDKNRPEIDRHLRGTAISPSEEDNQVLVADYPLLPTRRRFWERTLRAIDIAGTAAQLRTQLRVTHEATRMVADQDLGTVVPADVIYWQQESSMLQSGLLLREVVTMIHDLDDGSPEGKLRSRLCALIFVIGKLPTEGPNAIGLRGTKDTLVDLLVENLKSDRALLEQQIPAILDELVTKGILMPMENNEYRLQTREGAEWEADFVKRFATIRESETRIASERAEGFRQRINQTLKGLTFIQGRSKTPRKFTLHFGLDTPSTVTEDVPVWVRDEWSVSEKMVREDAQAAGLESPIVYVLLPRLESDTLRTTLARYLAAKESVDSRPKPSSPEGYEALRSMKAKRDIAETKLDGIVKNIINKARVYQGGGNEILADDPEEAIKSAVEASLVRLFPNFDMADHPGWGMVVRRAQDGAADCLTAIGYSGDAEQHPVCKEIRNFIGSTGKKGHDVRTKFLGVDFGWPRDAVDGALLALLAGGYIRAEINGQQKSFREVTPRLINQVSFYSEGVTVTATQRIGLRKILAEAKVPYKNNEEVESIPQLLQELLSLAAEAGGPAPLPRRPNTEKIEKLKVMSGNERFVAVFEAKEQLLKDYANWIKAKAKKEARLQHWQTLSRLAKHAESLPVIEQVSPQMQAIKENRSLLADPDPVPPLISALTDALRRAVQDAAPELMKIYQQEMGALANTGVWQQLDPSQQASILAKAQIAEPIEVQVGTETALLDVLDSRPLPTWRNRMDALPVRFEAARTQAARLLEPEAAKVVPKPAIIKTSEDLDAYLDDLRNEVETHLNQGNPVVISRN